jgi:MoaA/NifB/PqqE/SkfB family radical SAM enzyme
MSRQSRMSLSSFENVRGQRARYRAADRGGQSHLGTRERLGASIMNLSSVRPEPVERVAACLAGGDEALLRRFRAVRSFARGVRASEYHITNACNPRCRGCWFFAFDFDTRTKDQTDQAGLRAFIEHQRARHINAALLIGGEPTLVPDRIMAFVEAMDYVTISTNGLRSLPRAGFERVSIGVTLFGGGRLDDDLRAITPAGRTFTGLLDTALRNYRDDPRAIFNYAVTSRGLEHIEATVRRIRDNGNRVTFNVHSEYHTDDPLRHSAESRLLDEVLRVADRYQDTVAAHPYYLRALITGHTDFGRFGYDVCPSISWDHPAHAARRANGNPTLPLFNAYAADLESLQFCCTSGQCGGCRDSQAVQSWLLVSVRQFLHSKQGLQTWVGLAESYWRQFVWSPYHALPAEPCPLDARRGPRWLPTTGAPADPTRSSCA